MEFKRCTIDDYTGSLYASYIQPDRRREKQLIPRHLSNPTLAYSARRQSARFWSRFWIKALRCPFKTAYPSRLLGRSIDGLLMKCPRNGGSSTASDEVGPPAAAWVRFDRGGMWLRVHATRRKPPAEYSQRRGSDSATRLQDLHMPLKVV